MQTKVIMGTMVNQSTLRPTCVHLWDGYSSTRQRYRPSIICIPRRNSVHQAVSFRNVLSMTAIAGLCYNMFTFGVTVDNNRATQPVRAIMLDVEGDVDYPAYVLVQLKIVLPAWITPR